MKKYLFLTALITLHSVFLFAQEMKKIEGLVVDENDLPLPYVSLTIGTQSSTLSNAEGGFSLKFSENTLKDSVRVSYIGYKVLKLSLIKLKSPLKIKLEPVVNQLNEVVISALNGEQIIRNALQNIPVNYPSENFEMIGFYRETGKIDSNYLSFAEASLQLLNSGYQKTKEKDLIVIDKERNLKRVGDQTVENTFNGTVKGVPYIVLENDVVKNPGAIFGKEYMSKYNYEIAGYTTVNGEDAYLIDFNQKEGIEQALYKGTVIVLKSSFAIVAVDLTLSPRGVKYAKADIPLLQRPLMSLMGYHFQKMNEELNLKYRKIDDKWYPYFYKVATTHHIKVRKKNIDGNLLVSAELFISKINKIPKNDYSKKRLMPADYSFQQNVKSYTDDYWEAYDDIKPSNSLKEMTEKIKF